MKLLRALWRLFVLLLAFVALTFTLACLCVMAPVLWVLDKRRPFNPEIPQDLWRGR